MTAEVLQELVSSLSGKDKAHITAATALSSLLQGSLGRLRLEAALRHRLGVSNAKIKQARTFGDLCALVGADGRNGTQPESATVQDLPRPVLLSSNGASHNGVQVGIDVQDLAALPEAGDYWEHEFYKSTFSPREIAYALLQPSPRATFAGQWCAKEALRKANPALADAAWTSLEVVHDAAGKPDMTIDGQPAAGALSVSHAGDLAVAVFVVAPPPAPAPAPPPIVPAPAPAPAKAGGKTSAVLAVVALLIAVAALVIVLLR